MAEGPKIMRSDDGLFVRYEFDAHYVSDEDAKRILGYIDQLETENAKLREELSKWERLTAGIDLPECPVTQFKPKDLERENAKLRELLQDMYGVMWACAEQRCTHRHEGCFRVRGNHGDICVSERCWYEDRMSELGIEV